MGKLGTTSTKPANQIGIPQTTWSKSWQHRRLVIFSSSSPWNSSLYKRQTSIRAKDTLILVLWKWDAVFNENSMSLWFLAFGFRNEGCFGCAEWALLISSHVSLSLTEIETFVQDIMCFHLHVISHFAHLGTQDSLAVSMRKMHGQRCVQRFFFW